MDLILSEVLIHTSDKRPSHSHCYQLNDCQVTYRKVASSNTSRLEAHEDFFILLMKWIFDPYVCISIVANNFFYCTFTYLAKLF